jgi:hypothetical protein
MRSDRVSDMDRNVIVPGAAAAIGRGPDHLSVHIQR